MRIAHRIGQSEEIRSFRREHDITPAYRMVNTYPSEHKQDTGYYYSTYNAPDNVSVSRKRKVVVLGSGPIRIGQGVEFDYCVRPAMWIKR